MDLKQFTKDAIRTESTIESVETNEQVLKSIIEIFIASGNLLDMVKKNAFYGKEVEDFNYVKRIKEIENAVRDLQTSGEKDYITYYNRITDNKTEIDINSRLFHGVVGVATESTEMVEALEETMKGENPVDWTNVGEENGDIAWYQAILMDELNMDWEDVLVAVIAKLKKRYPNKFTSEDAINRNLDDERAILEEEIGKVGC